MINDLDESEFSILIVRNSSSGESRALAEALVEKSPYGHCYFAPENPKDPHMFLAMLNDETAGFLLMDQRDNDYTVPLEKIRSLSFREYPVPVETLWSVVCIWVREGLRRKGIARRLCLHAAKYFNISVQEFGWATPISEDGQILLETLNVDPVRYT